MDHLTNIASRTFQFFRENSLGLWEQLYSLTQNLTELQFLTRRYQERLQAINSAIQVQQAEVNFLERNAPAFSNEKIAAEITNLRADLQKLQEEKQQLETTLQQLQQRTSEKTTATPAEGWKSQTKLLIAEDKLSAAFDLFHQNLPPEHPQYNDFILLSAKLHSLEKQKELGLIALMEYNTLHNQLVYGLLGVLDEVG